MLLKSNLGTYNSSLLDKISSIKHGFTTRSLGDMAKNLKNRQKLLNLMDLKHYKLYLPEQTHGDKIKEISGCIKNSLVSAVDGLIGQRNNLSTAKFALGVVTADCIPLIFVENNKGLIAVVHAGWKGTLLGVTTKMIRKILSKGGKTENILVSIGPHIGMCCYDVLPDRALVFRKIYGSDTRITAYYDQKWHLDLGYVNYLQLRRANILPESIDAPVICSSCRVKEFYSYRKDENQSYGENLGIIAFN